MSDIFFKKQDKTKIMEDEYKKTDAIKLITNSYFINPFDNYCCDECSLPLKDYGCEPLIFGENDCFTDRVLCYKCSADFFGEDDYHSEKTHNKAKNKSINTTQILNIKGKTTETQSTVRDIFRSFAIGMSEKEILTKFNLSHKDILACYAFAAERI